MVGFAWLTTGLLDRGLRLRFHWLDLGVVGLVTWCCVASLWSAQHDAARPALNSLWEWLSLGVAYVLIRQLVATPRETRALVVVMISLAVALASEGLYQYFVTMPQTRSQFLADPDGMLREEGLWFPPGSVERELFEQRLFSTEPLATFALTNSLAGFLAPWVVIAIGIALSWRLMRGPALRLVIGCAGSILVMAFCLLLTKSRSAYIAMAVGVCLVLVRSLARGRHARRFLWAGIAMVSIVGVATFLAGGLDWQVLSEAPKSLGYRWQYWQATLQMISEHPLWGVGPGNFGDHYTQYKLTTASEEIADPHNFLLELAATAGVPAVLCMMGVLFGVIQLAARKTSDVDEPSSELIAHRQDGSRFLFLGGAAGFLLALCLPWYTDALIEAPLPWFTFASGLIAMTVAQWLWQPFVGQGSVPSWLLAIAALSLGVDLLAAGGISYPAVAENLWLLIALTLNSAQKDRRTSWRLGPVACGWAVAVGLILACVWTGYRPVLLAQSLMTKAEIQPAAQAEETLRQAIAIDPFAITPRVALADLLFQSWQARPSAQGLSQFEEAMNDAERARPYQAANFVRAGDYYLRAFELESQPRLLKKSVVAYTRAVQLYPHHARERAKLAIALARSGEQKAALSEAQLALKYDRLTPHADQKLRPELRESLVKIGLIESAL